MLRRQYLLTAVLLALYLFGVSGASAQDNQVAVPDLTGLSVPEAAALLNRTGLNLGTEQTQPWKEGASTPQNKVSSQSIVAGQQAARGAAIDVTVLRTTNVSLIYDYNLLTVVNKTGTILGLSDVTLNAFAARAWPRRALDSGQCAQISAARLNKPQPVTDCAGVQTWFWTGNERDHFWRSTATSTQFSFNKNGKQYALCNAAVEGAAATRCDIYVAELAQPENVEYVYFAYTTDQLIVRNRSKDLWMPLTGLMLINNLPSAAGAKINLADNNLYPSRSGVGSAEKLAPGQCLWFTTGSNVTTPPEACDAVGRLDMLPEQAFWSANFGVDGVLDVQPHTCPQATPGKLTICAMPR